MFGMVNTSYTPGLGVMEVVATRDAATLLHYPQHVRPGTIIWSDQCLQLLASVAQHETVNHSIEFVNLTTEVHTQNVESYWNRVKTKIKRMKGVHHQMVSSYLDEFMWCERHAPTASACLRNVCRDIALRYPV